jgi:hypothetical protein
MGFFTTRERAALGKSADVRPQKRVRELTAQDFAPRRRAAENDLAGHVQTLMQRVTDDPLQQIDDLIGDLRRRRDQLQSESARVQREILQYAKLNQSTMQSNKIITESLAHLTKTLETSGTGEPTGEQTVEEISEEAAHRPETFAPPRERGDGHRERGEGLRGEGLRAEGLRAEDLRGEDLREHSEGEDEPIR